MGFRWTYKWPEFEALYEVDDQLFEKCHIFIEIIVHVMPLPLRTAALEQCCVYIILTTLLRHLIMFCNIVVYVKRQRENL